MDSVFGSGLKTGTGANMIESLAHIDRISECQKFRQISRKIYPISLSPVQASVVIEPIGPDIALRKII